MQTTENIENIKIEDVILPHDGLSTLNRELLYEKFKDRILHNPLLDRTLVSFQANKHAPFYSWFKYKEGFSQRLVAYLLENLWPHPPGVLLDPFAGAGTALFAAQLSGWQTKGIEVLPVGIYAMQARLAASRVDTARFGAAISNLANVCFSEHYAEAYALNHIAITKGAFPAEEERQLVGYVAFCNQRVKDEDVRTLLLFAAFSVLEEISFTRKDGQYLRWDYRSGRSQGKEPFSKGYIRPFREAIDAKLALMLHDIRGDKPQEVLFAEDPFAENAELADLYEGSCLELLPEMQSASVDFVLTSPPYANRYDYTRTYALELVYLGSDHEDVKRLRQAMLSCTVENKTKQDQLRQRYAILGRSSDFDFITQTFEQQVALQEVLGVLNGCRDRGALNNPNINRLVQNYFYEMCFAIFEISRVMRTGGIAAMVNDNVRYAGEEIPVDLILSDIAESFGLKTRHIWTLGRGKGNSSQQMGHHGRSELRKCIYVWEKE